MGSTESSEFELSNRSTLKSSRCSKCVGKFVQTVLEPIFELPVQEIACWHDLDPPIRVLNPTEKSLGKARLGREELKIARLG